MIGAVWKLAGICTDEASAAAIELNLNSLLVKRQIDNPSPGLSLNIERLNGADVLPRADNRI